MKPAMAKVEKKPRSENALSEERLRELFREMLLIRRFEEKVEERFRAGELPASCTCASVRKRWPPASARRSSQMT